MPVMLPAAELREMRQKADRDKKDEAELASSMQRVEAEVGRLIDFLLGFLPPVVGIDGRARRTRLSWQPACSGRRQRWVDLVRPLCPASWRAE